MIRIHFFLLCALVHCLSSSVRCNQVNERACNEAIRCSLVRRAPPLHSQPRPSQRSQCWLSGHSQHTGINSRPCLSQTGLEDGLLPHAGVAPGLPSSRRDVQLWAHSPAPPGTKPVSARSLGFYREPASYLSLMEPFSPFSLSSPLLFPRCSPRDLLNMWKPLRGVRRRNVCVES